MAKKYKDYFTVLNDKGLHMRPSTEIVRCTSQFQAEVRLTYQDMTVDGKSLLGVLVLGANRGAKVCVEAEGRGAKKVVAALLELAKKQFNIKY